VVERSSPSRSRVPSWVLHVPQLMKSEQASWVWQVLRGLCEVSNGKLPAPRGIPDLALPSRRGIPGFGQGKGADD